MPSPKSRPSNHLLLNPLQLNPLNLNKLDRGFSRSPSKSPERNLVGFQFTVNQGNALSPNQHQSGYQSPLPHSRNEINSLTNSPKLLVESPYTHLGKRKAV